jgi:hypothetical protein
MNPDDFDNTAQIAIDYGVIKNEASSDAYIDTYAKQAVQDLKSEGADVNGADWQAPTVEVTPGGE